MSDLTKKNFHQLSIDITKLIDNKIKKKMVYFLLLLI